MNEVDLKGLKEGFEKIVSLVSKITKHQQDFDVYV